MILHIAGNRPQFIKMAPVMAAFGRYDIEQTVVHTGQHYDRNMSGVFFEELGLTAPIVQLHVGSGTHAEQTGRAMIEVEKVLLERSPTAVIVYGDTNSSLAGALAAAKLKIPVGHVEAGPRTFDRDEPEEVNRVVVDHLAKWNFCPDATSVAHLAREGITNGVQCVGDVMYDAFLSFQERAKRQSRVLAEYAIPQGAFALVTFHRPYNTDDRDAAAGIVEMIRNLPIVVALPLHPRTMAALKQYGLLGDLESASHVRVMPAVGYLDMLALLCGARVVLTDSGGLQKEAFFAGKGVIVLHEHTPWPQLKEAGWLALGFAAGRRFDPAALAAAAVGFVPSGPRPQPFGAGDASERIAATLTRELQLYKVIQHAWWPCSTGAEQ